MSKYELKFKSKNISEYLVSEILETQEPELQDFLLKTSILKRFCAPLCDELLNNKQSRKMLDWLDRSNLFVFTLDNDQYWFRYHHLFQNLLNNQLTKRYTPEKIAALHYRAGVWFNQQNLVEESIHHFLAAGHKEEALVAFNLARQQLMNQAQWLRLTRLPALFPKEDKDQNAILLLNEAWLNIYYGRVFEMFEMLENIETQLKVLNIEKSEINNLLAELNALYAYRAYNTFQVDSVKAFSEFCLQHLNPGNYYPKGMAWIFLSASCQAKENLGQATRIIYENLDDRLNDIGKTHLLLILNYLYWLEGDLNNLKRSGRQLIRQGEDYSILEAVANGHHFIGIALYQQNELEEAEKHLLKANELRFHTLGVVHFFNSIALLHTLQALEKKEACLKLIEDIADYAIDKGNPFFILIEQSVKAEINWKQNDLATAFHWAATAEEPPAYPISNFTAIDPVLIKLLIYQDTDVARDRATSLIGQLKISLQQMNNKCFLAEIYALEALLQYDLGKQSQAFENLKTALHLAQPGSLIRLFIDMGPKMTQLLNAYPANSIEAPFVQQLQAILHPQKSIREGFSLTNRELQILELMARHHTNKEISNQLYISELTVKKHSQNIFRKLDVEDRVAAVATAKRLSVLGG